MMHLLALVASVFGSVVTLWLAWSLLRDAKRQQTPRYTAHTWIVDERRDAKDSMSAIRAAHIRNQSR
jgi:membrane protein YqaA with SNARE-associated domain